MATNRPGSFQDALRRGPDLRRRGTPVLKRRRLLLLPPACARGACVSLCAFTLSHLLITCPMYSLGSCIMIVYAELTNKPVCRQACMQACRHADMRARMHSLCAWTYITALRTVHVHCGSHRYYRFRAEQTTWRGQGQTPGGSEMAGGCAGRRVPFTPLASCVSWAALLCSVPFQVQRTIPWIPRGCYLYSYTANSRGKNPHL